VRARRPRGMVRLNHDGSLRFIKDGDNSLARVLPRTTFVRSSGTCLRGTLRTSHETRMTDIRGFGWDFAVASARESEA
jgi:hypothetical protein